MTMKSRQNFFSTLKLEEEFKNWQNCKVLPIARADFFSQNLLTKSQNYAIIITKKGEKKMLYETFENVSYVITRTLIAFIRTIFII